MANSSKDISFEPPAFLAFFGTKRRRWVAAVAAVLGAAIFYGGLYLGLKGWVKHLLATSPCLTMSLQAADHATVEDYARHLAKNLEDGAQSAAAEGALGTGVLPLDGAAAPAHEVEGQGRMTLELLRALRAEALLVQGDGTQNQQVARAAQRVAQSAGLLEVGARDSGQNVVQEVEQAVGGAVEGDRRGSALFRHGAHPGDSNHGILRREKAHNTRTPGAFRERV